MIAVPGRYNAIVAPFGVVGAIVVEASPRLEDNQWILDHAANAQIIVGLVGRINPADPAFAKSLEPPRCPASTQHATRIACQ
jgi:L-fuconolactonase